MTARRAPVLHPCPAPGWGPPAALRSRVWVDGDGRLLHRAGTAPDRALAAAGAVTAITLLPLLPPPPDLPAEGAPWVHLARRDAGPLLLPVGRWVPGWPSTEDDPLTCSGTRALVDALGHDGLGFDLDDPPPGDAAAGAEILDPGTPTRRRQRAPLLVWTVVSLTLVALWLAHTVVRLVLGDSRPPLPLAALAPALAAVAVPIGWILLRLLPSRPARLPAVPGVTPLWPASGRPPVLGLQEGGDLLLALPAGVASLPGPASGGVEAVVALTPPGGPPIHLEVRDAADRHVATLPVAGLGVAEAAELRAALASVGVGWEERRAARGSGAGPGWVEPLDDGGALGVQAVVLLVGIGAYGLTGGHPVIAAGVALLLLAVALVRLRLRSAGGWAGRAGRAGRARLRR